MKHIIIIGLLIAGCGSHQSKPLCRTGDYRDRSAKKAMIQPSKPYPTLRVVTDNGQAIGITLSETDLDALECSLSHYRDIHGYAHRDNHTHSCGCGGNH